MKVIHIVNVASFPLQGGHSIRNHNIFKVLNKKITKLLVVSSLFTIDKRNLFRGRTFLCDSVAYQHMLTLPVFKLLKFFHKIPVFNRPLQFILIYFNYLKIKSTVNIKEFDIIHGHSNHKNGLSAYLLAKKYKKPFIYDLHALSIDIYSKKSLKYLISKKIESFLIKKADVLISIDEELKDHIIKSFNVPSELIFPAPNGIDSNFFIRNIAIDKSNLIPKDRFVIGIDNSKALENSEFIFQHQNELIKNFPNLFFVVFGNKDSGLQLDPEYFRILPKIEYHLMPQYYSILDLFLMPRFYNKMSETITPLKILEVMSSETPVLVSNVKGLTSCIEDNETGYIFNLSDGISSLINRLKLIIETNNLKRIGQNGRQWVIDNKNWEITANQYVKAYNYLKIF
ncbi:MAG: glycosyltransferase family 4 protein [Bacteroidales bacterium]|nr:glycosyltransferase family 4 protein [Bacteroidales bacterium]